MSDESGSAAKRIGGVLLFLAFAGAVAGWFYLRESAHPSERGAAACSAVETYLAAIGRHHGEAAWRSTAPGFQATTTLAAHTAQWREALHGHGRVTSVAVVERSASVDYRRVTVRATLGTSDPHFMLQLDYDVVLGDDGKMRVESGCHVTEAQCAAGAW